MLDKKKKNLDENTFIERNVDLEEYGQLKFVAHPTLQRKVWMLDGKKKKLFEENKYIYRGMLI